VIFAHSVAASRALKGPWRLLMTLGTRPLGAALFADPRVSRRPLRFRQIRCGHELYRRASSSLDVAPASLWARRSLFVFHGSQLLVTEVFLPAILALTP
jgi:chorismate--pyruvate lyase